MSDAVVLRVIVDGDGGFSEVYPGKSPDDVVEGRLDAITGLARGMTSGAPSVALMISLPDGKVVFAQTSLRLFLAAGDALKARHGDPRQ